MCNQLAETLNVINTVLYIYDFGQVADEPTEDWEEGLTEVWIEPDNVELFNRAIPMLAHIYDLDTPIPSKVTDEVKINEGLRLDKYGYYYNEKNLLRLRVILELIEDHETMLGVRVNPYSLSTVESRQSENPISA